MLEGYHVIHRLARAIMILEFAYLVFPLSAPPEPSIPSNIVHFYSSKQQLNVMLSFLSLPASLKARLCLHTPILFRLIVILPSYDLLNKPTR